MNRNSLDLLGLGKVGFLSGTTSTWAEIMLCLGEVWAGGGVVEELVSGEWVSG